jgi:hypothetical protein
MDETKSFMYVISSDEKTNTLATTYFYDIEFGGFATNHQNYQCEVISFSINGNVSATPTSIGYFLFMCEDLADDGIFMVKKISNRDCLISMCPLYAVGDAFVQSDGSRGITFRVNKCQTKKNVRFKFIKPDFTTPSVTELNVGGETKWILVLRMTPLIE